MNSTKYIFNPNPSKIMHALIWFCQKNNNDLNKVKAVKLMFFADRYHLRKYGRLLSFDTYYAMRMGPVCSKTKDMTKIIGSSISGNIHNYSVFEAYNPNIFSKSDKEALEFSLENFNKFTYSNLVGITHDYPEWKRYEDYFNKPENKNKRIFLNIFDFYKNPAINNSTNLKLYLKKKDPFSMDKNILKYSKIIFDKSLKTIKLWNQ